jgi:hypothetical protein
MRRVAAVVAGVICAGASGTVARGDGGPGPGVMQGWDGVARGNVRYVAIPAGRRTALAAIRRHGGRVVRFRPLRGLWGIPLVAYDGTTEGLARDGRTIVLGDANGGYPVRKRSSFLVLDARRFRILERVQLQGDFSFDALSPDARYLYLVEHLSGQDATRYRVRAYDLRARRLLARIVADKSSWETDMQGMPVSRLTEPHGRWAYTLYGGTHARPFIHALDLRRVQAVCIDLPWRKQPNNIFRFRLRLDGEAHLVVRGPEGRTLAVVDKSANRLLSFVRKP